jgi:two-component system osmolarity sensor histidine kinase EnvZ
MRALWKPLKKQLKRYLPKSLFGRAVLIVLLPILGLQGVAASLFVQRHYDRITGQMASAVAHELNYAIARVEEAGSVAEARAAIAEMSGQFGMEMGLDEGATVETRLLRNFYDVTGGIIHETFKDLVRRPLALDLVSFRKHAQVRAVTRKGVLMVLVPRGRLNPSNPHQLILWTTLTALALAVVAVLFLRNEIRPIRELAQAASAFGRGLSLPFRPSGALEVRAAGAAFLNMRARIERQIEQRTRMLSGVSHDLRTPLTRIKLALAVAGDHAEMAEIARDVDEMEHMLAAFLDFARGEGGEAAEPVDPVELAAEIAADARRRGVELMLYSQVETPDARLVELRRGAMKRCITNLVENAAAWGSQVALSTWLTRRFLEFTVEDDGPGIPEDKRETVLRPFTRLDEARGQNFASGVGLGLSIAQDIARSHGGALILDDSPRLGGLRATVSLPR